MQSLAACGGSSGGGDPGPAANVAPVAQAPANLAVDEQTPVTLNGTETDSDGTISSYHWSQTAGTAVTLTNVDQSTLEFTPGDFNETLTFQLVVTDNLGATATSTADVVVSPYFTQLSAGTSHYCAIVAQNSGDEVYCWGSDSYELNQPMQIDAPSLINTKDIVIGYLHASALDDNGVQCWGANNYGQLDVPTLLNPVNITASRYVTCAQDDSGLVCWGYDLAGVLDAPEFTSGQELFGGSGFHHCGIDQYGLVCWGDNRMDITNIPELLTRFMFQQVTNAAA